MPALTKSPRALAQAAMAAARDALPAYSCPKSRHDFTQHQLVAILALRQFWRVDYRGVIAQLQDMPELCRELGLAKLPHYSTLCYAEQRLLKKVASNSCSTPFLNMPAVVA